MKQLLNVVTTDCSEAQGKALIRNKSLIYCRRKSLREIQTLAGAVQGCLFYMVMNSSLQTGSLPSLQ